MLIAFRRVFLQSGVLFFVTHLVATVVGELRRAW